MLKGALCKCLNHYIISLALNHIILKSTVILKLTR